MLYHGVNLVYASLSIRYCVKYLPRSFYINGIGAHLEVDEIITIMSAYFSRDIQVKID